MSKLVKTSGVVLHNVNYSESSVISKIYTEELGLQSFIIKGARSRKSKVKTGLIQPGTIVEMVVYYGEKRTLHHIREIRSGYPYSSIPFDMLKSSVLMFIIELFYRSVREEESNPDMFRFLQSSLIDLDRSDENVENEHIYFAVELMRYLGFYPRNNYSELCPFFNMQEGLFQQSNAAHESFFSEEHSLILHNLLNGDFSAPSIVNMNTDLRIEILDRIIAYYKMHLPIFQDIRSHLVLREVLR